MTQSTKQTLNRLGVFTVSSFHAFVCARSPSLLNNLLAGRGATKRRTMSLSRSNSQGGSGGGTGTGQQQGQQQQRRMSAGGANNGPQQQQQQQPGAAATAAAAVLSPVDSDKLVKVTLPDNQVRESTLLRVMYVLSASMEEVRSNPDPEKPERKVSGSQRLFER